MALLPNLPDVEIHLRRSARAKRFSLRVSRLDGKVSLTLPSRAKEKEALNFLAAQEEWLRGVLETMPQSLPQRVAEGLVLPVLGEAKRITLSTGRGVRVDGEALLVSGSAAQLPAKVAAFLRALARERLAEASERYSRELGLGFSRIVLRDTRSRWGSCSHDGVLMYSWRLAMAPHSVLDYVAAHEVAHLKEMNHSPSFWAVVTRLCPAWKRERDWLRHEGQSLHRYRFEG